MADRTRPPFRADHVGSLLRPPELLHARSEHLAGRINDGTLRRIEDRAVSQAVRMQESLGLRSATDGEFRRSSWHMDFIQQIDGIGTDESATTPVQFRNTEGTIGFNLPSLRVQRRIRLGHTIFGDDFTYLRSQARSAVPKLTIPSPNMVHYRGGRALIDPAVYPDIEGFWNDLADAYAREVRNLGELGCTYLQFDDTSLAYLNDPAQRQHVADIGGDPAHQHETYVRNINRALRGRPGEMSVTVHLCRGNFQSSWAAEGGYDFVAEALFGGLEVDGFFLEYDDERSGGFQPLRFVPPGKVVVLGLVTTKRGQLESKDELKRRIEEASRYVDLDRLCLSPQCGFSSTVEGNRLTLDEEKAKLQLVVETAAEVWS